MMIILPPSPSQGASHRCRFAKAFAARGYVIVGSAGNAHLREGPAIPG